MFKKKYFVRVRLKFVGTLYLMNPKYNMFKTAYSKIFSRKA